MQLYRLDEQNRPVPYNVVDMPKRARRTTPTPTFLPPSPVDHEPTPVRRERSSDMLGWVLIVTLCGLWFVAGVIVGRWVF